MQEKGWIRGFLSSIWDCTGLSLLPSQSTFNSCFCPLFEIVKSSWTMTPLDSYSFCPLFEIAASDALFNSWNGIKFLSSIWDCLNICPRPFTWNGICFCPLFEIDQIPHELMYNVSFNLFLSSIWDCYTDWRKPYKPIFTFLSSIWDCDTTFLAVVLGSMKVSVLYLRLLFMIAATLLSLSSIRFCPLFEIVDRFYATWPGPGSVSVLYLRLCITRT
mgnify:CR=1 FL=1